MAPQRALVGSLLRTAARSTPAACSSIRPVSTCCSRGADLSTRAWRATTVSGRAFRPVASASLSGKLHYSTEKSGAESRKWEFPDITRQLEVNQELEKTGKETTSAGEHKVIFVDVREPGELHQTGKIPGAINIPITSAAQSFHISDEDFEDLYGFQRPAKDAHLMFYCKAGIRARGAAGLAQHAGWTNIGDYAGSWNDWAAQNGPVENVKKQS